MLEYNTYNTNFEKKGLYKKKIFRNPIDASGNLLSGKRTIKTLEISSPILQHSTSIFSVVSPTQTQFPDDLYKPTNSPPPIPNQKRNNQRYTVAADPRDHPVHKRKTQSIPRRHSYSSNPKAPSKSASIPKLPPAMPTSSAAASIQPTVSKSTPLKKVKTYNLQKKIQPEDKEKMRKVQELEDLITGRRGSTLRLTLTPKGL